MVHLLILWKCLYICPGAVNVMKYLLLIMLLAGCTICEPPYSVVDGACCLDKDSDMQCDNLTSGPREIVVEKEIVVKDTRLFSHEVSEVSVEAVLYEPEELMTFFVTPGKTLESARMSLIPECDSASFAVYINGRVAYSGEADCDATQQIELDSAVITEAVNELGFSSADRLIVDNASIYLEYADDTSKQNFDRTVVDSKKVRERLQKETDIKLQNYEDLVLDIVDKYARHTLLFTNDGSEIAILLNDEPVYQGDDEGSFKIELPNDELKQGKNTIRVMLV